MAATNTSCHTPCADMVSDEWVNAQSVGLGVDLVHIPSFDEQLAAPGTTFARVFRDAEWEYAQSLGSERVVESLAARWAAKEAVIKAWSQLLFGEPPAIEPGKVEFSEIEVVLDPWHRPALRFHGEIAQEFNELAFRRGGHLDWQLSLSHDGDYALAEALAVVRVDHRTA